MFSERYPDELDDDDDEYSDEDGSESFWNTAVSVENMSGTEFEHFCADLLRANGYTDVRVTTGSGDQGVDIVAEKEELKWAFQCKHYTQPVGNLAVREVFAGKAFYHCDIGVVITNNTFTNKAEEYARETGILLWGQDKLYQLMEKAHNDAI
jgi:HJR/Mrr/RecB family endonuclease